MPKTSRFFSVEQSQISEIAVRIERRMRNLGLTVSELSEKCSVVAAGLSSDESPSLSRPRIAKILMNRRGSSARSAARVISGSELMILACALEVSIEWLSGQKDNEDPIVWNVLAEPQRAAHLLHLLEEHEESAGETVIWGEYLLSPLMTEEFMYAFHEAHYGAVDTFGIGKDKSRLVQFFNKMGKSIKHRVLRPGRSFTFTGLIYNSELQRLAAGTEVYRSISRAMRKRCLENLVSILMKPSLKVDLVIVDDAGVGKIKATLRDYETVGVVGEVFSMWNYHSGSIGWSEHQKYINHHKILLDQMKLHNLCGNLEKTTEYIKELASTT